MSVATTVTQAADSFAQIEYALMLEFREKLKEHAETFDLSKVSQLNQELQTLQMQLNEVQMLRDRTLQIGKQKEERRASFADVASMLGPHMSRVPYMTMESLSEAVLQSIGGDISSLDKMDTQALTSVFDFAIAIVRNHHPRIYNVVLSEGVGTLDSVRKFLTAVIQQQL